MYRTCQASHANPKPTNTRPSEDHRTSSASASASSAEYGRSASGRIKRNSLTHQMTSELLTKSIKLRNLKARKDAILKFNTKPKHAISYLRDNAGIDVTEEEFAQWIYEYIDSLSKKKLGEFLGGLDSYSKNTFTSFLSYHDFTDLKLSDALRQLLLTFRLPGEAQVIDRILESFASR